MARDSAGVSWGGGGRGREGVERNMEREVGGRRVKRKGGEGERGGAKIGEGEGTEGEEGEGKVGENMKWEGRGVLVNTTRQVQCHWSYRPIGCSPEDEEVEGTGPQANDTNGQHHRQKCECFQIAQLGRRITDHVMGRSQ